MPSPSEPRRREIFWLDWNPARGSEQAGHRPGLIVSNDRGNRASPVVIVAAIMSRRSERRYPFQVWVDPEPDNGLAAPSVVLCSQLVTVSKGRLDRSLRRLSPRLMEQVNRALMVALGLI